MYSSTYLAEKDNWHSTFKVVHHFNITTDVTAAVIAHLQTAHPQQHTL